MDALIILGKHTKYFTRYFELHSWVFFVLCITSLVLVVIVGPTEGLKDEQEGARRLQEMYSRGVSPHERILANALANADLHWLAAIFTDAFTVLLLV